MLYAAITIIALSTGFNFVFNGVPSSRLPGPPVTQLNAHLDYKNV